MSTNSSAPLSLRLTFARFAGESGWATTDERIAGGIRLANAAVLTGILWETFVDA